MGSLSPGINAGLDVRGNKTGTKTKSAVGPKLSQRTVPYGTGKDDIAELFPCSGLMLT